MHKLFSLIHLKMVGPFNMANNYLTQLFLEINGGMRHFPILILTLFLFSCKEEFNPRLNDTDINLLVVEGYIDINSDESIIKLSRTQPLQSFQPFVPEKDAILTLRDERGNSWKFEETQGGNYKARLNLPINQNYRLLIKLKNGSEYESDPMLPIITPEIEDLGFIRDENGVEIFVSTKGNDQAQFFLWDYEEHWIFRPGVQTPFKYNPASSDVESRGADERIDLCWNTNLFPKLILQNAARFEDNSILQRELVRIPLRSEKLMQRYSIKVRQRAIDSNTFQFWEIMRRNSDDIGGIFSPLPSLLTSNIKDIRGGSAAIGFVSMGQSSSKRIYINNDQVRHWQAFQPEYEFCRIGQDTILVNAYASAFSSGNLIPARPVIQVTTTIGFLGVNPECADCTLRGTNLRPEFWED
jgi:hypothetical protein